MDLNPYRSPQVDPAPPAHVWTPNYRSAAFAGTGLVIVGYVVVCNPGRVAYAQGSLLEIENIARFAVWGLAAAGLARGLWRALKYGERA